MNFEQIFQAWLTSCQRGGKISRNTVAMGIVVLDHLKRRVPLKKDEVISKGGEVTGSRGSLGVVLERHGVPATYLKECTTRQTHQDGQHLFEAFSYGESLATMSVQQRDHVLDNALGKLREMALAWLNRQRLNLRCDHAQTPFAWLETLFIEARERSGGKVEQHLVGAKLARRHPHLKIPNHPGHAGDQQTGRTGDFIVGNTCFHVTASPGRSVIQKCAENIEHGLLPTLLVPRSQVEKARHLAEGEGLEKRIAIVGLEDFVGVNVMELAEGNTGRFPEIMHEIVEVYNERLGAVETDLSLKIDIQ